MVNKFKTECLPLCIIFNLWYLLSVAVHIFISCDLLKTECSFTILTTKVEQTSTKKISLKRNATWTEMRQSLLENVNTIWERRNDRFLKNWKTYEYCLRNWINSVGCCMGLYPEVHYRGKEVNELSITTPSRAMSQCYLKHPPIIAT